MNSDYKIIIIDEVHMLTTQAFNALLRTLEEPPPHGKFILATTDIQKVPMTIISRCQRFDFHRLPSKIITEKMIDILKNESVIADSESLHAISIKSTGSMRDALSTLEQVIAFSGEEITFESTSKVLGLIPLEVYFNIMNFLKEKDHQLLFNELKKIQSSGTPPSDFLNGLNEHIRNLMIAPLENEVQLLEVNKLTKKKYIECGKLWDIRDLLRISEILDNLSVRLKQTNHQELIIEMTFLKLMEMDSSIHIDDLLFRLNNSPLKNEINIDKNENKSKKGNVSSKKNSENPTQNSYTIPDEVITKDSTENKSQKTVEIIDDKDKVSNKLLTDSVKAHVEISIDKIEKKWSDFIEYILGHKQSVGTLLQKCEPRKFNKKQLEIYYIGQSNFNFDLLERNKPWIAQSLENIILEPVFIKFIHDPKTKVSKKNNDVKSINQENHQSAEEIVSQIIETFDGEIIN